MDTRKFAPSDLMSPRLFSVGAPGLPLYLSEPARAGAEYGLLLASWPILPLLPRGDAHPVLVLPGLLATDSSTSALRWVLRYLGYPVEGWLLGLSLGPTAEVVDQLHARLDDLADRHGRRVTVIGWSLGGLYARAMARRAPEAVRQVITLGSPFRAARPDQPRAGLPRIDPAFERFAPLRLERWDLPLEHDEEPIAAPRTSIYSRSDGVVPWTACLDDVTASSENVEVHASHLGLGHHPAAVWAVADRLAQPDGGWQPFAAPALMAAAFPAPADPSTDPSTAKERPASSAPPE